MGVVGNKCGPGDSPLIILLRLLLQHCRSFDLRYANEEGSQIVDEMDAVCFRKEWFELVEPRVPNFHFG